MKNKALVGLLIVIFILLNTFSFVQSRGNEDFISLSVNKKLDRWVQEVGKNASIPSGFGVSSNFATRGLCVYNNELYIGTHNMDTVLFKILPVKMILATGILGYHGLELFGNSRFQLRIANSATHILGLNCDGCELWRYNNTEQKWAPLVSDTEGSLLSAGFNSFKNYAVAVIKEFKDDLYIGTATNSFFGCEIWRYNKSGLEKVVENGFGDRSNSGVWSAEVYKEELYIGTMNWKTGCEVWKTSDGANWEEVNLSGGNGFGSIYNIYAWSMGVYNDYLYLGTCNLDPDIGAQLWRYNGINWDKVILPGGDGFGNSANYGIRNIVEYQDEIFFSTAANVLHQNSGCEIWKYDENKWTCLVGDKGDINDGFGNIYNKYAWSMISSDDKLWVGTANIQPLSNGIPFSTTGCEIWYYNGSRWTLDVGTSSNISGGFGNNHNIGARSMIEYPIDSKNIWVGTFNLDVTNFNEFKGLEIWKKRNKI